MMEELARIERCAQSLIKKLPDVPERIIVLGSGLGAFADRLKDAESIPYASIDGFPVPTVEGHRGELIYGKLGGRPLLVMAGRFHYYEGHELSTIVLPLRVLAFLGVKKLMITNAAGGINTGFSAGDLMLITDHLNLTGRNPLMGDNIDKLGPRFPDMSYAYSPRLCEAARAAARREGISLKEGVYAWMSGPSYETPAEVRMLRTLGADAAGMSTVPEVIAAHHAKMEIAGVSLITNMAAGVLDQPLSHEEVIETADEAAGRFETLASAILEEM